MTEPTPADLTAAEAASLIREGSLSSTDLVEACLHRIKEREPEVGAWAFLDPDYARAQARAADEAHRRGLPQGPLHGVPVGIKDIIDTRDMPTEYGTVLHEGRRPSDDATTVALLREAGAVIMGKTVTTEFAVYHPGKTRNPHDTSRTPGGSSSGSAAATACGMVPLALGTQTNGSVVRPASYCGVFGFKPSFGLISRKGVLAQSRPLDTLGVFARSIEDVALATEAMAVFDAGDPDMRPGAHRRLVEISAGEPPVTPSFAFVRSPVWSEGDEMMHAAFAELLDAIADHAGEVDLPEPFERAVSQHRTIMLADLAKSFAEDYARGADKLSGTLRGMIEEGQAVTAVDYNRALDWRQVLGHGLSRVFDRFDAIVTPATTGVAPTAETTGSPVFCTIWTYLGLPSLSVPLLAGNDDLPLGVQIVGPPNDDARLLRTARWLVRMLAGEADGDSRAPALES